MMRSAVLALVLVLLPGCGGPAPAVANGDWTRFNHDAARTGVAPRGPSVRAVKRWRATTVRLPGTVDASPIRVGRRLVLTTTYGITLALDAATLEERWRFRTASYDRLKGSAQITTATPVADPSRRFVYAASPDGRVHKLDLADGAEQPGWPVSVTKDPTHEKIASALNVDGPHVLVTTGGYIGDAPPYQGKVVAIRRADGRIDHVFNSLCADRRRVIVPSSCDASDSAIWGRGGAVVDPVTHRIYVATGNGPYDGRTNWGDSVLELGRGAARLRRHYTPGSQAALERSDADVGSASPALLPAGRGRRIDYVLQGGKDDTLRLLAVRRSFHPVHDAALGGELQSLPQPGGQHVFTAPLVWHHGRRTDVVVATNGGTAAYRLRGGRLRPRWSIGLPGTSPVMAGRLLYVYDPTGGLVVLRPGSGEVVKRFDVPEGHWNSPIVTGGRLYLPTGDANQHRTDGALVVLR